MVNHDYKKLRNSYEVNLIALTVANTEPSTGFRVASRTCANASSQMHSDATFVHHSLKRINAYVVKQYNISVLTYAFDFYDKMEVCDMNRRYRESKR